MEFQEKAELLKKYKGANQIAQYYKDELQSFREKQAQAKIQVLDDMPHAKGNNSDLSDVMVKIEELEGKVLDKMLRAEQLKLNIAVWVQSLENVNERLVLMYHYLRCFTYSDIAKEMNYSEKSIRRLRNKAVEHLPDPDFDNLWV